METQEYNVLEETLSYIENKREELLERIVDVIKPEELYPLKVEETKLKKFIEGIDSIMVEKEEAEAFAAELENKKLQFTYRKQVHKELVEHFITLEEDTPLHLNKYGLVEHLKDKDHIVLSFIKNMKATMTNKDILIFQVENSKEEMDCTVKEFFDILKEKIA